MIFDVPEPNAAASVSADDALTTGWGLKFSDGKTASASVKIPHAKLGVTQRQYGWLVLAAPDELAFDHL
jgi:hypothetical protein